MPAMLVAPHPNEYPPPPWKEELESLTTHVKGLFENSSAESHPERRRVELYRAAQVLSDFARKNALGQLEQASVLLLDTLHHLIHVPELSDNDEAALIYSFKRIGWLQQDLLRAAPPPPRPGVLMVALDLHIGGMTLADQLRQEKTQFVELRAADEITVFETAPPDVLVLGLANLELPDWQAAIQVLNRSRTTPATVIAIGSSSNFDDRLRAHRAGAHQLYSLPEETARLASAIALLRARRPDDPYRVLVVDDNSSQADYNAHVLQSAGIRTCTVNSPRDAWKALREFRPELMLTDIYMPECNGTELAAMVRQDSAFLSMPIVFLSTEQRLDRQLAAMNLGGDDFLTKPVEPWHLLGALLPKLEAARRISNAQHALHEGALENRALRVAIDRHAIVSIADVEGCIVDVNDNFVRISGYTREELIGANHRLIKSDMHDESFFRQLWDTITSGSIWQGRVCNRHKNGSAYWVDATIVPVLGADNLPRRYLSVRSDITDLVEANIAMQRSSDHLMGELHHRHDELRNAQHEVLERLIMAAEHRDTDTGHHVVRMARYAALIAHRLGLPDKQIELLTLAAPMHDVGKIGIPDHILLKQGKLTAEEFEVIKRHTVIGASILASDTSELLQAAREIALYHHEKFDGSGYPKGLKGDDIPLLARICAVADVFDAVTTPRPYKRAWSVDEGRRFILEASGSHFDPEVVAAFTAVYANIEAVHLTLLDSETV